MQGITIIGPGRLGGALALALGDAGYAIDALVYRSRKGLSSLASSITSKPELIPASRFVRAESGIVILSAQDEDLPGAVEMLRNAAGKPSIVFHTSGSLSSDILKPLKAAGASVASLHPLSSVSSWKGDRKWFKGAFFAIEGDVKAQRVGTQLVRSLGGHPFLIDSSKKPLYHAAAVMTAGHVTALFDIALELITKAGLDRKQGRRVLQPLLTTVAANLASHDTDAALTGTYARGDEATMHRHLTALRKDASSQELDVYLELALRSISLAEKHGLDPKKVKKLRRAIKLAKDT